MSLVQVTAPTMEPLTLGEVKDHLRVEASDDDALLEALITVARTQAENMLGRALVTQTWDWKMDCWPRCGYLEVPLPPLQSVTSITYLDSNGDEQTWDSASYQVDAAPDGGRIALAYGETFPSLRGGDLNAVVVRFVAGYGGPEDVPETVKAAMKLLVHHWYQERRPVGVAQLAEMPFQVSALLMPHKVWSFGA